MVAHPLEVNLMSLATRNGLNLIPFSTHAESLNKVEVMVVQHFPPRRLEIACHGILHSMADNPVPFKKVWRKEGTSEAG
jgi:hypothetical protein